MRKIKLITYKPLCSNIFGINAIKSFHLNPFIDSSCRREPDLELSNPSISGLCRKDKLAPKLNKGDIIIYLTLRARFKATQKYLGQDTYNLTAVLEVIDTLSNHESAYKWYKSRSKRIPSNCMVKGNPPKDFNHTGSNYDSQRDMKKYLSMTSKDKVIEAREQLLEWDKEYKSRANDYPSFVITKYQHNYLKKPIRIHRNQLEKIFNGSLPGTQNPKNLSEYQFNKIKTFITNANKT